MADKELEASTVAAAGADLVLAGSTSEHLADLTQFRRWSLFLPRAACHDAEMNLTYVRSRHTGNPKFFEQTRDRLLSLLRDLTVMQATPVAGGSPQHAEVLEAVLQAQLAAQGFLRDRQFHKALCLGESCVELVDALAASGAGGLLFWRILCRANLGDAYARFRRPDNASELLKQALELTEQQPTAATDAGQPQSKLQISRERVVAGACYAHLSRIHLAAGEQDEAMRCTDLTVEVFERFIWDLGVTREDREAMACVLATSYSSRGVCDIRRGKYESALAWLARAQECVEKHQDLSRDSVEVLAQVKEQINHTRTLQM